MQKSYPPKGTNSTPFNPQLQHFDMICGQVMKENGILKLALVVLIFIIAVLSIGISFFLTKRTQVIPAIVTMNDFGQAQYVGEVSRKNFQNFNIPEVAMTYQVKDFINIYKSLSSDKEVVKRNIEKAYHLLTAVSASKYSTLLREDNPYKDFGDYTREVEFETEPLKISKDTYQVDYRLITRTLTGVIIKDIRQRAVITIKALNPTEEDIQDNPLGIYITDFDIKDIK
nr:VirB8/TrbF family protein [uncultured Treponema sp.]